MDLMDTQGAVSQVPLTMTEAYEAGRKPAAANGSASGSVKLPEELLTDDTAKDLTKYTSSKGINFKVSKVQSWIIAEAVRKLKPPKVPVYYSDYLGREEENPAHPDYIAAMEDFQMERGKISVIATLGFGTEVIGQLPEGVEHWNSEVWSSDLMESLDIEVPVKGKARYAAWLRMYALTDEDSHELMQQLNDLSGAVRQEDAVEAVDNFRSESERSTDTPTSVNTDV